MNEEHYNNILKEENMSFNGMNDNEKNLCLRYLKLINEFKKANIIQLKTYKKEEKYILNGMAYIECNNDEFENLTFESEIIIRNNELSIYSEITKLYSKDVCLQSKEEIETCDTFSIKDNKLIQKTYYFNPNKIIEIEQDIPNDFNEVLNINNKKSK